MSNNDFDTDIEQELEQPMELEPADTQAPAAEEVERVSPIDMLKEKFADKRVMMAAGAAAVVVLGGLMSLFSSSAPEQPPVYAPTPMAQAPMPVEAPGEIPPPPPPASADPLAWNEAPPPVPEAIPAPAPAPEAAPNDPFPPAPGQPVAEAPAPEVAAPPVSVVVEERLNSIEKAVTTLQEQSVTKADIEALQVAIGKLQQEADTRQIVAEEKKEEPVKKAAAPKTTPVKKNWVMKSAKPGIAWVAEKGSRELRTVSVGDTLPGLGRIREISRDSAGSWVIIGDEGKITQ